MAPRRAAAAKAQAKVAETLTSSFARNKKQRAMQATEVESPIQSSSQPSAVDEVDPDATITTTAEPEASTSNGVFEFEADKHLASLYEMLDPDEREAFERRITGAVPVRKPRSKYAKKPVEDSDDEEDKKFKANHSVVEAAKKRGEKWSTSVVPQRRSNRNAKEPERLDINAVNDSSKRLDALLTYNTGKNSLESLSRELRQAKAREATVQSRVTIVESSEDELEEVGPDPSQGSVYSGHGGTPKKKDALGLPLFSPPDKTKYSQAERKKTFADLLKGGHLGDEGNPDTVEEMHRVLDHDDALADVEDKMERDRADQLNAERQQRAFWAALPVPTQLTVSTEAEDPGVKAILENLHLGLSNPAGFICSLVVSKAMRLTDAQRAGVLTTMIATLLHPLCPPELAWRLSVAVEGTLRQTTTTGLERRLTADYFVSILRNLGAREHVLPAVSSSNGHSMDVDDSNVPISHQQRQAAVLRLVQVVQTLVETRCVRLYFGAYAHSSVTTTLCVKVLPIIVRLSVDPRARNLRTTINAANAAMIGLVSADSSIIEVFRSIITILRPLSPQAQYSAVLTLPARAPIERSLRRWLGWSLLVSSSTVDKESILNLDAVPKYIHICRVLGYDLSKFKRPKPGSPFDPSKNRPHEALRGAVRLLHLALSDLQPYITYKTEWDEDKLESKKAKADHAKTTRELRLIEQGLGALRQQVGGSANAVTGEVGRAQNWQDIGALKDLLSKIIEDAQRLTLKAPGKTTLDDHFKTSSQSTAVPSTSQIQ